MKMKIENIDFYPYRKPVKLVRSKLGALATVASAVIILTAIIQAGTNVRNKIHTKSRTDHGMATHELPLPKVAVFLNGDMGKAPYMYNTSYYRVVFMQRVIFEAYTNPERKAEKIIIPAKQCTIKKGNGNVQTYCPDVSKVPECQQLAPDGKSKCLRAAAEFSSDTFRFLQIEIQPCPSYRKDDDDFKCAPSEELDSLFYKSYSGTSLYIHDQVTVDEYQWTSKAYNTFEPNVWLGVEVLMKPSQVTEYDFYGKPSKVSKFLSYDSFYTRRSAVREDSIAKIYVKYADKSQEEDIVYFGFSSSVEMIGSTWALIGMTIGAFAYARNAAKNANARTVGKTEKAVFTIAQHVEKQQKEIEKTRECLRRVSNESHITIDIPPLSPMAALSPQHAGGTDIVFSFDTTGSMSSYLDQVRKNLVTICNELLDAKVDIRIAVIAHGDYCDTSTYVLRTLDFTSERSKLTNFINSKCGQTGGGDAPECYEFALYTARHNLSWRKDVNRAVVIIGDDNPHPPSYNLNTKNIDWRVEANALADDGSKIYSIQCNSNSNATKFYEELASIGNGQHLCLNQISTLPEVFVGLALKTADPLGILLRDYAKKLEKQGKMTGERKGVFRTLVGSAAFVGTMIGAAATGDSVV